MSSQLLRKYISILEESLNKVSEKAPPGAKAERLVKNIKAGYAKDGHLTDKEKAIAYATAWKAHRQGKVEEKWDTTTQVSPEEKGKYKGRSKAELLKQYNTLKASGPHPKGSKEYGTMRELAFAIRAKSNWGKVKDE